MDATQSDLNVAAKLKRRATLEANKRDHLMTRFQPSYVNPDVYVASCKACHMEAVVNLSPVPGAEHITGDACFKHCNPLARPAARPLTFEQVRSFYSGKRVYSLYIRNSNGQPREFKVTRLQFWKRDPERFLLVLSGGPQNRNHQRFEITQRSQLAGWTLDDPFNYRFPND